MEAVLSGEVHDAQADGVTFLASLRETYGDALPAFEGGSWRDALEMATRRSQLLLVYLHSADHPVRCKLC